MLNYYAKPFIPVDSFTKLPVYVNPESKQPIVFVHGVKNLPQGYEEFFGSPKLSLSKFLKLPEYFEKLEEKNVEKSRLCPDEIIKLIQSFDTNNSYRFFGVTKDVLEMIEDDDCLKYIAYIAVMHIWLETKQGKFQLDERKQLREGIVMSLENNCEAVEGSSCEYERYLYEKSKEWLERVKKEWRLD